MNISSKIWAHRNFLTVVHQANEIIERKAVWKNSLIVRVGPDSYEDAPLEAHVKEFDITGRPMKGWVLVEQEGVEDEDQLKGWMSGGRDRTDP